MTILRILLWLLLAASAFVILSALTGPFHPALDAFGIWLGYAVIIATAVTVVAGVMRRWRLAAPAALLAVVGAAMVAPHTGAGTTGPTASLKLVQHNVLYTNDAEGLSERMADADVIALQEVNDAVDEIREMDAPWTVHECDYPGGVGKPAVLTRLPVRETGCLPGGAWLRAETDAGAVTFVSLHLPLPWPDPQIARVSELIDDLRALPRPVVVAGDFNQAPWSVSLDRIRRATDTQIIPGLRVTHTRMGGAMRMMIDHVLIPEDWSGHVRVEPSFGSDHRLLDARLTPGGAS